MERGPLNRAVVIARIDLYLNADSVKLHILKPLNLISDEWINQGLLALPQQVHIFINITAERA